MFYFLFFLIFTLVQSEAFLNDDILYYEILDTSQIRHTQVQKGLADANHIRRVQFRTHHQQFTLNLRQNSDILTDDFDVTDIDKNTLYTGYVKGDDSSDALIYIYDDVITGVITTHNDTFHIEKLRNYLAEAPAHQMIVYIESNIQEKSKSLKTKTFSNHSNTAGVFLDNTQEGDTHLNDGEHSKHRIRRSSVSRKTCTNIPTKNICPIYLVADYNFFRSIGGGDVKNTIYHMLQAIRVTDQILKETEWNYGIGCHVGLAVKAIKVYQTDAPETPSFNRKRIKQPLNHDGYLSRFSQDKSLLPNWEDGEFCLAHVFTYRDFKEDVLGLAYIGEICNKENVAFSNYFNSGRKSRLVTLVANLVTAHEIVHNFGARHDNTDFEDNSSCNPGDDSSNGNYLMYDTMLSGKKENNDVLSPCSKESISILLMSKLKVCFIEQNQTLCMNGMVDENEACDPGIFGNNDECCDKNCQFKEKAECSDFNHVCCTNCRFTKNRTKICRYRNDNTCFNDVYCDGVSSICPGSNGKILTDNSTCDFGRGNCMVEGCVPVCEQRNQKECDCANCHWCCVDPKTGGCAKVRPQIDGTPCSVEKEIGKCVQGSCIKIKKDIPWFKEFTFSKLGRFLKQNIVGAICVFSILFWAPVACFVNYLDKKQEVEEVFHNQWSHPNNSRLVLDRGARKRIRELFKKEGGSAKRVSGYRFHISS